MKKRMIKRFFMMFMVMVLIMPTLFSSLAVRVNADEEDSPYVDVYGDDEDEPTPDPQPQPDPDPVIPPAPEPQPDPDPVIPPAPEPTPEPTPEPYIDPVLPPEPTPTPEPTPEPIIKAQMKIAASPTTASFGTVEPGDSATLSVTVSESGNEGANLAWYEVDNDDFFSVTAPSQTLLMPGDAVNFILTLKSDKDPGNYSGSLSFVGSDAAGNQSTAAVTVTATIKGNTPHVDSVVVSPGSASVKTGGSIRFSATVNGSYLPSTAVTWRVRGCGGNTNVDENGFLTVGTDETAGTIAVVASSVVDPDVQGSADVRIVQDKRTHYVSVTAGDGGTVSGGGTVEEGKSVTVYASPNAGYTFKGWYDDAGSFLSNKKNWTIASVMDDLSLNAKFVRAGVRVVTYSSPDNGGVTSGDGTYNVGTTVTVKASANSGYYFKYWKSNNKVVSKDKVFKITNVNNDLKLTAVFERNRFTVTTGVSPAGAGAVDGAGTYDPGSNVTLKAYAESSYNFKGWYSNYQLLSESTTFTINNINSDVNITAVFEKRGTAAFLMTSTAGSGGKITPAVSAPVPAGSNVSYTITPDAGYYISDVKIDGQSIGAVAIYGFTNVQANHTIEAFFAKKDENKGSKSSADSDVTTGKTMDEAKKDIGNASKSELDETKEDIVETKLNTDMDQLTGVLQKYNMTPEEAYLHINDEIGAEMFLDAFKDGYITFTLNNDYSFDGVKNTSNDEVIYAAKPTIANMEEVYDSIVTDTEAIGTLAGYPLEMNIDVTDMTGITDEVDLKAIEKIAKENNLAIDNIFDITVLKTYEGVTNHITEFGAPAEFTLKVPATLRATGSNYKIIHVHNGEAEILDNLSTDPDEIVFRTDRLSSFAMAYDAPNSFEAGKITGEPNQIYVDKVNDSIPGARTPGSSKVFVIVLLIVIVLCLAAVVVVLVINNRGRKSGPKPPAAKTT